MLGINKLRTYIFKKKYNIKSSVKLLGKIVVRGKPKFELENDVVFYPGTIIWGDGTLKIGEKTIVGDNCFFKISKEAGITIGKNVMIAAKAYLIDCNHLHDISKGNYHDQGFDFSSINISNNCWIGTSVTILPGVCLGENVVVAANAAVNNSFNENLIIGGVPARALRQYDINSKRWNKYYV